LQHFSFEANQGVAYLDAGDLDRAEVHFSTAEQLLGRADMSFSRVNLACNRGGLALERGDVDLAEEHFRSVPTTKGAAAPRYASDVITAGLGLCAIERGALARARQLEEQMRPQPTIWYYDPFLIVAFRARLAERRGDRQTAIAQLAAAIEDLQGHLGTSALKLRLLLARTALKAREPWAQGLALEGVAACEAACFPVRATQFRRIAQAPAS
jgi:tetratricopeptide (TPR) repeat protein